MQHQRCQPLDDMDLFAPKHTAYKVDTALQFGRAPVGHVFNKHRSLPYWERSAKASLARARSTFLRRVELAARIEHVSSQACVMRIAMLCATSLYLRWRVRECSAGLLAGLLCAREVVAPQAPPAAAFLR